MTDYDKFTSKSHCFLDVWDLPLRENINSGGLPRAIAEIRKPETTEAKLRSLEPQGEHSIRVFIEECCDSKEGTQETKGRYNPPSNLLSQNGFKSLISQLRCDASQWYQLDGYDFALDAKGFVSDSLARRKLPLRLSMAVQAGIDKLKSSMEQYRDTWARTSRSYITIRQGDDQGAVYIKCTTGLESYKVIDQLRKRSDGQSPFESTEKFTKEFLQLTKTYMPMMTNEHWPNMITLQYYHASLNVFVDFLQQITKDYTELRAEQFDPRTSRLQNWLVVEIKEDAYYYRQFQKVGDEMTTTLQSLVGVIDVTVGQQLLQTEYATLKAELQGSCSDMRLCLTRFSEDLEHSLKLLDLSRNFRQNNSVQRLTVLATFFLPMSLATGILSMGTRFKDLGPLLYDFFGVLVLVITFVVLYLSGLFLLENKFRYLRLPAMFLTFVVVVGYGPLVLSSFLVGMFDDVVLGAKILGFGTAASIVAIPIIAIVTLGVFIAIGYVRTTRKQKQKRNQEQTGLPEFQESAFLDGAMRAAFGDRTPE